MRRRRVVAVAASSLTSAVGRGRRVGQEAHGRADYRDLTVGESGRFDLSMRNGWPADPRAVRYQSDNLPKIVS